MADGKAELPSNLGKREGLVRRLWQSYLESYLQRASELMAVLFGSDSQIIPPDYKIIKDLIPDIQLRNISHTRHSTNFSKH